MLKSKRKKIRTVKNVLRVRVSFLKKTSGFIHRFLSPAREISQDEKRLTIIIFLYGDFLT